MHASFEVANNQPRLIEDMGIAITERVQSSLEEWDFRGENNRSNEEKKNSLENRKETADHSKNDKKPSKDIPVELFRQIIIHIYDNIKDFAIILIILPGAFIEFAEKPI